MWVLALTESKSAMYLYLILIFFLKKTWHLGRMQDEYSILVKIRVFKKPIKR